MVVDFQNEASFSVFKRSEALFYRHAEHQWLALVPALQLEERWEISKKYLLEFLPSSKVFEKPT